MTSSGRPASSLQRQEAAKRRREAANRRRDEVLVRSRERREASRARQRREVSLVDLVDRLLDGGVVIHGDITLAVADVDLLYVGLRALVASVETLERDLGISVTAHSPSLDSTAL
jgi:Gas vesicle protein